MHSSLRSDPPARVLAPGRPVFDAAVASTPILVEDAPWHELTADAVLARLETSPAGLSADAARARLMAAGANELVARDASSWRRRLWEQFTSVMVLILIGAVALSLALGKFLEAGVIGAIVVLFALLGFFQEQRAERAIAALRRLATPEVRVVRDGATTEVSAADLVPGDIVALEAGNVIAADLRLVESVALRVQEAVLTGESDAVDKHVDPIPGEVPVGDRRNMAYSGTHVTYGRGRGVVVATGMSTELGRVAALLAETRAGRTPLQHRLDRVGRQLALVGVAVACVVVALGAAGGESASDLVLTAVSVAVAVIPEGLPAVVTFTLAMGAQRMLRRNALIRKLPAVETLGSVTVICSDKTGTLTENRMKVAAIEAGGESWGPSEPAVPEPPPSVALTLALGALCNDGVARPDPGGGLRLIGDPTETALLAAAHDAGIPVDALRDSVPRVGERPFDSKRKRMSTIHRFDAAPRPAPLDHLAPGRILVCVKGAADELLGHSEAVWTADGPVPLCDERRREVVVAGERLAGEGMRVLGVAFRAFEEDVRPEQAEVGLTFVGLVALVDPPRAEVADAIETCRRAGIRTVMITGDHPVTAAAIARDLGMGTGAVTGAQLDGLDDDELRRVVASTSVFARVSPEHKLRVVRCLQENGEVVAMTGDGVNDAPALKRADIGVAMGITGTDVSKEASEMVLRDDNFATIVAAVEEGRVIYDNLRRFVAFAVAGNLAKVAVMVVWPLPFLLAGGHVDQAVALLPLQLLWLNLMTDGLLGLSMGAEPAERDAMRRPPQAPDASLWVGGLGRRTVWIGAVIGATALAVGYAYEALGRQEWQTMIFTTLVFLQVSQALATRSSTRPLSLAGLRSNPLLPLIVGVVVGLQLLVLYSPLRDFLELEALALADLALSVALALGLLILLELAKARGVAAAGHGAPRGAPVVQTAEINPSLRKDYR